MYKFSLLIIFPFLFSASISAHPTGSINPNVTQENIKSTICVSGYTKTIRPPVSYTNALKKKQIKDLKYIDTRLSSYEEDHYINMGIGGHPTDPKNLWPEPYVSGNCGAKVKDVLEQKLQRLVCSNKILLKQAQKEISNDWVASYNKHIGKLVCK